MELCEHWPWVYYCFGLQRNPRFALRSKRPRPRHTPLRSSAAELATRAFSDFEHATLKSWSRARRVIAKAESTPQVANPRFLVTNLPAEGFAQYKDPERFRPALLDHQFYCPRGQIKYVLRQQLLHLKAYRLSTHYLRSYQLRLLSSALAYLLLERVRTISCAGTEPAVATVGSVRLKLFKAPPPCTSVSDASMCN